MKTKIQIKSYLGSLLFKYESENNTIKKTLEKAVSSGASLSGAYLSGASLSGASLSRADLRGADLSGAYLSGASLSGAYLSGASLSRASLRGAYLRGAYLSGASLSRADLERIIEINRIIPADGAFIGYKSAWTDNGKCIIKLEIPADAKRHTPVSARKCRAEFAKVLEIRNSKGHKIKEAISGHNHAFKYKVGEIVKPDSYDPDPFKGCSNGIHFFISRIEAKEW